MTTRANPERNGSSLTRLHRVLVVEDHAAFRRIVCELLQESAAVQIVGEAADGLDAVRKAEALQPDVVVLDINLPTMSGLEVASHIRAVVPSAKVVFITVELSLEVMDEAFRRGAHGYVYKPRAQRDLLSVLDAIHKRWPRACHTGRQPGIPSARCGVLYERRDGHRGVHPLHCQWPG